jgi:DNA-directed RNA polymerase specialized sigma24 family protein
VLAGDREAFGRLIDRHRDGATRFALRILRMRADAEDVVQGAWLLGIVVNLAKSRLRARRETPVADWAGGRAIPGFVWMDAEPPPDVRQEARELHDRIWSALRELSAEQQETVQLHYVDGLRVWEIAALVCASFSSRSVTGSAPCRSGSALSKVMRSRWRLRASARRGRYRSR